MGIYIVVISVILCYCISNNIRLLENERIKRLTHIVVFIMLWLIAGLRYNVGTDFKTYKLYFDNLFITNFEYLKFEIGYKFLNYILRSFTNNSQYIFLLTSFIILFLIFKSINENSKSFFISIFAFVTLYFYLSSFNIIRQYIAIAITFYGIKYIKSSEFFKYLICILIASLFHKTAFIMIPLYFLLKKQYKPKIYMMFLGLSFVTIFFLPQILKLIFILLPKYSIYLNYDLHGGTAYFATLFSITAFIYSYINREQILQIDNSAIVYINAMFYATIFGILSFKNILFFRLSNYVYIFIILLIPICLEILDKKQKNKFKYVMYILLTLFYFYQIIKNNGGILPYNFNFNLWL